MQEIAIFWWAFNPPTLWHYHIIEQVFKNSDIEKIIIVPDWLRLDKNYAINEKDRKKMIEIFVNELNKNWYNIELDDYFLEWKNNSDTTTYEVDKYFINKLGFQPYHIFWTDISEWISNWSGNPDKYIQKKLKKIFVPRKWYIFDNYDLENYELLEIDSESSISSTKVKNNIQNTQNISKLVNINIEEYINKNNLYK